MVKESISPAVGSIWRRPGTRRAGDARPDLPQGPLLSLAAALLRLGRTDEGMEQAQACQRLQAGGFHGTCARFER
jgi:hypothetical protein